MFKKVMALPLWQHGAVTVVAFGAFQWVKGQLDASSAASGYPVDYATGQLAFDAGTLEGYYAVMQQNVGLDAYWTTQTIDFGFIIAVMVCGTLVGTLVARLGRPGRWGRRMALAAAGLAIAGASLDVVENLLSFIMLRHPADISQAVALVYSSAAASKFTFLITAMLLMLVAVPFGLWSRRGA